MPWREYTEEEWAAHSQGESVTVDSADTLVFDPGDLVTPTDSQDPHFGQAGAVEPFIVVRWPDGQLETLDYGRVRLA
jgi:hypothetical protein